MSENGHTKHYSAADIQQYLEGKMLPAEMHALEKAALDDPFLADAIEGMQETFAPQQLGQASLDLQALQQRVAERIRESQSRQAPVRAFRWWRAAAAAVIVVTGGLIVINAITNRESPEANKQVAFIEPVPSAPRDSAAVTAPDQPVSHVLADSRQETGEHLAPSSVKPAAAGATTQASPVTVDENQVAAARSIPVAEKKEAAADQEIALHKPREVAATLPENRPLTLAKAKADSVKEATAPAKSFDQLHNQARAYYNSIDKANKNKPVQYEQIVIGAGRKDSAAFALSSKPRGREMNRSRRDLSAKQAARNPDALLSGFVSGRVTDQSNNPLSNALLRVEGKQDFYTDKRGQFKIPVQDSVVNVAVGITGYYTQNLRLSNNTNNNISLNQLGVKAPNPQLNEALRKQVAGVEVADNKSRERNVLAEGKDLQVMVQDAEPEYGWLKFKQYLEKNKKLPAEAPDLTGSVVVSFEVNKKGQLSDFNIEQSLHKLFDEEAIRLIKAGPSWKLNKGRKAKATVVVRF